MNTIEQIWNNILSRNCEFINSAYKELDEKNQKVVMNHLKKMAEEDGWHLEQKKSAQIALAFISRMKRDK